MRWKPRYFSKYENGFVYAFYNGATSWSSETGSSTKWEYAKLAEAYIEMEDYND